MEPKHDSATDVPEMTHSDQNLCTYCNMCCAGMIFGKVDVTQQECDELGGGPEFLSKETGNGLYFLLKCGRLTDWGGCSRYENRPAACRKFSCDLLVRVETGLVEDNAARQIVDEAKTLFRACDDVARSIVPTNTWPESIMHGVSSIILANLCIQKGTTAGGFQAEMKLRWQEYNAFVRDNFATNTFSKQLNFRSD